MTATAGTSTAPTARLLWHRSRWFLLGGGVILLTALLISGLGDGSAYPPLDPRSADPDGARAVVRLLEEQGLTARTVSADDDLARALEAPDTTVVLPEADLLGRDTLDRLAEISRPASSRLVLIAPGEAALGAFAPGVRPATTGQGAPDAVVSTSVSPMCTLPEATRAGTAEVGGLLYRPGPGGLACYPRYGRAPLIVLPATASEGGTVVLGTGHPLVNRYLTTDGNAALALGLLGSRPHLVWYLPDYGAHASAEQPTSLADYVPRGWSWAALQLGVAAVLAALWRARRLGPVVSEDLPVVVRATETTEGRARLYQRARARDRAAHALRTAAAHRLAAVLGVPLTAGEPDPTALATAVAARVDRPAADIRALLQGPAPTSDAALVRLTDDLDALERQVRQP